MVWRGGVKDLSKAFVHGGEGIDEAVGMMFEKYPAASSACSQRQPE